VFSSKHLEKIQEHPNHQQDVDGDPKVKKHIEKLAIRKFVIHFNSPVKDCRLEVP